jgi:hypothetical protein
MRPHSTSANIFTRRVARAASDLLEDDLCATRAQEMAVAISGYGGAAAAVAALESLE